MVNTTSRQGNGYCKNENLTRNNIKPWFPAAQKGNGHGENENHARNKLKTWLYAAPKGNGVVL